MAADESFGLPGEALAAAFPFHLVVNRDLKIVQSGAVIQRLCTGLVAGASFSEHFKIRRPMIELSWEEISARERSLFLLEGNRPGLLLRGMFVPVVHDSHLAFLGSPWITNVQDLDALGVSLHEFAIHDPIADLLFLLQTKDRGLTDAKDLAEQLRQATEAAEDRWKEKTAALVDSAGGTRTSLLDFLSSLNPSDEDAPQNDSRSNDLRDSALKLASAIEKILESA